MSVPARRSLRLLAKRTLSTAPSTTSLADPPKKRRLTKAKKATTKTRLATVIKPLKDRPKRAAPKKPEAPKNPCSKGLGRDIEKEWIKKGFKVVVGTDEAGRGPLAGPVVAAACWVPLDVEFGGMINDSKKLNEADRDSLFELLTAHPRVRLAAAVVGPKRIDDINILQASMEAMALAVAALPAPGDPADFVLVDGPRVPKQLTVASEPIIKGDSKCFSIAAASIIAKVLRDRIMVEYALHYPLYNLAQHKGYPTKAHQAAVLKHGPSSIHRLTFAPIKHMNLTKHEAQIALAPATIKAVKNFQKTHKCVVVE